MSLGHGWISSSNYVLRNLSVFVSAPCFSLCWPHHWGACSFLVAKLSPVSQVCVLLPLGIRWEGDHPFWAHTPFQQKWEEFSLADLRLHAISYPILVARVIQCSRWPGLTHMAILGPLGFISPLGNCNSFHWPSLGNRTIPDPVFWLARFRSCGHLGPLGFISSSRSSGPESGFSGAAKEGTDVRQAKPTPLRYRTSQQKS